MTEHIKQNNLLDLPTTELLDEFGSGGHKPGSGSAAALMGILSCKLLITVCMLSCKKKKYQKHLSTLESAKNEIETEIEMKLKYYFNKDAEVFDEVIRLRKARDNSTNEKDTIEFREKVNVCMMEAIEIPFQIAEECSKLIKLSVLIYNCGYKSARGDSGAAMNAAIAGVTSSIFIINLNLRSFESSEWKVNMMNKSNKLLTRLQNDQHYAIGRIEDLLKEKVTNSSYNS